MFENKRSRRPQSGEVNRREIMTAMAAAGILPVTMTLISRPSKAASDHPTIFTWAGFEDVGLHPSYIAKHGESPNFSFFGSEEEALAKLRAGYRPNVVMPGNYSIPTWRDAGVVTPIDETRLSNWPDIIESLKDLPGVLADGKRYWVPQDWGQVSITYRTDLVDIEEESWGLLWDERYAGRIAVIDGVNDTVLATAIYAGVDDPFNMSEDDIAAVRELLQKQKPLLRYYTNNLTEVEQALASGELVAAMTYNESVLNLSTTGVPVKYMNPKQGMITWAGGHCLTADADSQALDGAYDIIDAMMSPEAGQWEIENYGYGHSNRKAFDLVSETDLKQRGLTKSPEDLLQAGVFQLAARKRVRTRDYVRGGQSRFLGRA